MILRVHGMHCFAGPKIFVGHESMNHLSIVTHSVALLKPCGIKKKNSKINCLLCYPPGN